MTAKETPPAMDSLSVAAAAWFVRPQTQAVFACLNRDGFEVRAVGGAVRNSLLGRAVTEVDFATNAKPEDIVRLADAAGLKTVPTGIAHGTVTLVAGGVPFEVTALRRDVATDGRHATVAFGGDWAGDARRRDFTMNALYADAAGKVHDPLGGVSDLRAGRVRFVGDASTRIREDYLRTLRFFRFSADYSHGDFDAAGVAAAIGERAGLSRLSRERVRMEMLRVLVARRASEAIAIMDESGLLLILLGGVVRRARFERLCQIETELDLAPDAILRLAALGLFVEEDAGRLAEKLRLSSQEAKDLEGLSAISPAISPSFGKAALEVLLYKLGVRLYLGRLLLAWANAGALPDDAAWRFAASLAASWRRPSFPLSGADLIALGLKPGPAMGALLKTLEERWAADGFTADRETLLDLAKQRADAEGA
ncbi:MAG: CCA tRNA nucleotidyltransferase [Rhodomicrobium sp.]